MFRLPKKKPDAAVPAVPAWHPNFRNFERLPDTKVVRTAFFINGVAVLIAIVALGAFLYQEYQLHELKRQVSEWQDQIARDQKASNHAITLFKKFETEAVRLNQIDVFLKSKPAVSPLLLHLAETLPHNIALDVFDLNAAGLRLTAAVRGAPDLASGYASAYLDQLRSDPVLSRTFGTVSLLSLTRNTTTGRLTAEYALKLKGADKKP